MECSRSFAVIQFPVNNCVHTVFNGHFCRWTWVSWLTLLFRWFVPFIPAFSGLTLLAGWLAGRATSLYIVQISNANEKSTQRRRKHCALAVVRRSQKISSAADPLPGGTERPKFNQLEMVTTFTYRPSLVKIDERNFELSQYCSVACINWVSRKKWIWENRH